MSVHRDEEISADTAELVGERQTPGRMIIEVEFSPDDVQRLKRGLNRDTKITRFIRNAALEEADRRATSAQRSELLEAD